MITKNCNKPDCSQVNPQPIKNFRKSDAMISGFLNQCKSCILNIGNQWRRNNRDKDRINQKRGVLKAKYGITLEQYNLMLQQQNYCCAICKEIETQVHRRSGKVGDYAVDHNHKTGEVRMLLCGQCNKGLGCFRDNPTLLKAATSYLGGS